MEIMFACRLQVGFNNDGKIAGFEIDFYSNGGNTLDLSPFV